jgi:adenine-specific DNA-methyltransferase
MDEVFGAENCLAQISVKKTSGATSEFLPGTVDFIIAYANNKDVCKFRSLYNPRSIAEDGDATYTFFRGDDLGRSRLTASEIGQLPQAQAMRVYRQQTMTSQSLGRAKGEGAASWFPVEVDGSASSEREVEDKRNRNESPEDGLEAGNQREINFIRKISR